MILVWLYLGSYLLGSIPFAVIMAKAKGVDILKAGSGNPGMTNVGRVLGPKLGALCFALDILKGLIPTVIARLLVPHHVGYFDAQFIWLSAGLVAIAGHCCSVFLRFKGGKGVSTALGMIIGASPIAAAICFGVFLFLLLVTRYVSVASMIGVGCSVVCDFALPNQSWQLAPILILLTGFVVYRHRANIRRLMDGTEPKIKFSRNK